MHHYEVTSIYRKRDFPPPTPCKLIGTAKTPERTQAQTHCHPGETQGKTVLLWSQTPPRLLLLSKWREVVVVCGEYDGRCRGGGWFMIFFMTCSVKK